MHHARRGSSSELDWSFTYKVRRRSIMNSSVHTYVEKKFAGTWGKLHLIFRNKLKEGRTSGSPRGGRPEEPGS